MAIRQMHLKEPFSIVLMKPVAEKLFGNEDPLGKTISIENGYGKNNFKVMGVIDESLGKTNHQSQYVHHHEQRWYGRIHCNN